MKHCPTCAAPVDTIGGDDSHFCYRAPKAVDLNAMRLETLTSFRRALLCRFRLRPAQGFLRLFEDEYLTTKRLLTSEEDRRGV